jgi:1,4-alpha-glucan branching enzyme
MKKFKNQIKNEAIKIELGKIQTIKPAPEQVVITKPVASKVGRVSFEFVRPEAKNVCVAGSFNDWKPEKAPLVQMGNGRWVGDLPVKPGRYEYLFVVDGQWMPDPNAKESVQNPFGGRNSIVGVSE